MYQAVPTFHIASDENLGGRWEWGQHVYISQLDALFVKHTSQMYIYNQREYVWAHSQSQFHSRVLSDPDNPGGAIHLAELE